jgi:RNA polymerase sigma-70 factor (ECF subfamily)
LDEELENELIEQSVGPQNIEEWAMARQQKALIEMATARLPYKERTAFILRDFEGLSTEEVANVLGVRTATVRVHVSSARARVRRYCERLISRTKERLRNELRPS